MNDGYLDFDEYIVASEPHKRQRAVIQKVGGGLNGQQLLTHGDALGINIA